MQVLLFTLGEARCGVALTALTRVLPAAALTPVPGAPAGVAGLLQLQGEAVPVLDLARLAGAAPGPVWRDSRILLLPLAALRAAATGPAATATSVAAAATSATAATATSAAAIPTTAHSTTGAGAPPPSFPRTRESILSEDRTLSLDPRLRGDDDAGESASLDPRLREDDDVGGSAAPPASNGAARPPSHRAAAAPRQLGLLAEHVLGIIRIDPAALVDSEVARAPFIGRVVAAADGLLQLIEPAGLLTPALRAALSWPEGK